MPKNGNWDQLDSTSSIRLGYGKSRWNNPISAGGTFRGHVDMGGKPGSCQLWDKAYMKYMDPGWNPYIVGVGSYFFNESLACGQCLRIRNPKNNFSIVSVITDYCPPPCGSKQLDIQLAGSAFLASGNSLNDKPYKGGPENYNNLEVWIVQCSWDRPMEYYFDTGSSAYHWYLIILYANEPATRIQVDAVDKDNKFLYSGKTQGHDKFGRWVIQFKWASEGKFRIKYYTDNADIVDYIWWSGKHHTISKGKNNTPVENKKYIKKWPL